MIAGVGRPLRGLVLVILALGFLLPILAGLFETMRAGFGYFPALGAKEYSLEPWRQLLALPGLGTSLRLTLSVGIAATALSLVLAFTLCSALHGRRRGLILEKLLTPLLAAPHAAAAIGLAFVLAPSGWLARLFSPWATGWTIPPDLAIVNDRWGLAIILGLMVKEVPYLLFVMLAALGQVRLADELKIGQSLGYSRGMVWLKLIAPQVYPQIRLSVYVVLSFALSVVDVAMILGPGSPPTLAVSAMRWLTSPDVGLLLPATAAAILQAVLVVLTIAAWWLAERLTIALGRGWIARGRRGKPGSEGRVMTSLALAVLLAGGLGLLAMALWSVAWHWPFPHALPAVWTSGNWTRSAATLSGPLLNTILIGLTTACGATLLAISWLETESKRSRGWSALLFLAIYVPLLLPQITFLYGFDVFLNRFNLNGSLAAVIWAQALFVFPYVMLTLRDPWAALDGRYARTASALGASPLRILLTVKIPLLLRPVLAACAVGFSVSIAQYLATLFMGEGRIATLTTEAVSLSSGADRRIAGVYATLQTALPWAFYSLAIGLPALLHANRKGLGGARA